MLMLKCRIFCLKKRMPQVIVIVYMRINGFNSFMALAHFEGRLSALKVTNGQWHKTVHIISAHGQ